MVWSGYRLVYELWIDYGLEIEVGLQADESQVMEDLQADEYRIMEGLDGSQVEWCLAMTSVEMSSRAVVNDQNHQECPKADILSCSPPKYHVQGSRIGAENVTSFELYNFLVMEEQHL